MSITIKDVARHAGTTPGTVSKVLNGTASISEETKQRVHASVKALNYHPNSRARNFASQKTMNVTFLAKMDRNIGFENPHLFEIITGLGKALEHRGYSLTLKSVHESDTKAVVENIILNKLSDAVVVHAGVATSELAKLLIEKEFPHFMIGQRNVSDSLCWIDANNHLTGEIATNFLFEKGHTQIAFVGGKPEDMICWKRQRGYRTAFENRSVEINHDFIIQSNSTTEGGKKAIKKLLALEERPTALICANNYIAFGVMQVLIKRGIRIPEEIALITLDDFPFSTNLIPQLTAVDIDMYDMGYQSGEMLMKKIKNKSYLIQSHITLPQIIERKST